MSDSLSCKISKICAALVFVAAGLFVTLMIVAQVCVSKPHVAWCLYYVAVVMLVWLVLEYGKRNLGHWFSCCEMWFLVFACFVVHCAMIAWLPEFGQVGMSAPGDSRAALMALNANKICHMHQARDINWSNYEVFLSALGALWRRSLSFGQMLNGVCHAMTLLPIYCISRRICGNGIARLTTILTAFSPTVIAYSALLASECLSSMLLFYAAFFFLNAMDCNDAHGNLALSAAMCGIFLGLSSLFKAIGFIFFVAMAISLALWIMRGVGYERAKKGILIFFIVIGCQSLSMFAGQWSLAALVRNDELINRKNEESVFVYEFLIGLDVKHDGMFSAELIKKIRSWDESERKRQLRDAVKRDWRCYPKLMVRKFCNIHGSHACPAGAISHFSKMLGDWPRKEGGRYVSPLISLISDNSTFVLRILLLLGTAGVLFARGKSFRFVLPGVFSMLVVLSFAAVEQLIEGHGRYKVAVYPFYFMLVPYICVWFEMDIWHGLCVRMRWPWKSWLELLRFNINLPEMENGELRTMRDIEQTDKFGDYNANES